MLDTETKRRIDTCRDILVGKVPDPKSQVEQITIALIYKFMDDMDAEAEELGGKRSFFAGKYAKYGWAKLMAPGMGGFDMLALYSEAIGTMTANPGIPPLFRDIFKNAYLPYRDPETLKSFLKEIDWFDYDHSEKLGDAFEYLLSVLGSQGDAGQFRTPRHIIDFMVAVVDPQKHESILDPACGTAGFLISAWKHILKHNTGKHALKPDERQHLAANIHGYDISPDMVRLSLVNMYLHGFTDPHIVEYDTLTSDEKWNETADVILANPPFMSPKGGIKPHKRFSIQAKRSEVLFVDYMAEHLSPTGRAAIIVPEGIIFQSQTAYKQLRKMLVANSLVAVVSLPAGIFNPYAGVKTSILILDKSVARKSDSIAFFKVENDGYGLGAQRRAFDKNDLPQVKVELAAYLHALRSGQAVDELLPTCGLIVPKAKIAANGDYNLSGERYREGVAQNAVFPHVRLDAMARITAGNSAPQGDEYFVGGDAPFIRTSDVGAVHLSDNLIGAADKLNAKAIEELRLELFPAGTILFPKSGASTFLNHRAVMGVPAYVSSHLACIICDEIKSLPKYVYAMLCRVDARSITPDQAYPSLRLSEIGAIQVPLPPLEVQKEIVAEIEGYQKVINGARAVLDHYRPHIPIHPDWPMVKLGEVCHYAGGTQPPKETFISEPREGYIRLLQIRDYKSDNWIVYIPRSERHKTCEPEDVMIGRYGPPVFQILKGKRGAYNVALIKCIPDLTRLDRMWLYHFLSSRRVQEAVIALSGRVRQSGVNPADLDELEISLPPLATQQAIVAEIEAEQALVAANRELIARFEKKIQATLARVWGEEEAPAATAA